ncbi:uncharacterized protein TNCV_4602271 [Trichonephila clavipes]|nr:uncharacterized protein TNCV_4602271 [Trichonephila clavipes]
MLRISREHVRQTNLYSHPDLGRNNIIDITVSYHGTWHKRGHTSLYGIGIVIDIITSLVVDFEVLSKYCHECSMAAKDMGEASPEFQIWKSGHSEKCQKNFDGSSEECVNHVAKRLGTALRNKVKEWRSKGVTLDGRKQGSLTDATITKLQNFYRKAIVDNVPEVEKMKASIFATLFHCMSTDAKPMHSKCPDGKLSWCFYNRAKADNKVPGSHKSMKTKLSEEVVAKIVPVYQRLASNEILLRCVSGKTQNANESLHSCIWRKCPKDVFVSKKRINLAVTAAVSEVNIGYVETLKLNNNEMVDATFKIAPRRDNRSKASQNRSAKLMPRRDGPYIVLSQRSPITFVLASCDKPDEPLGLYHTSAVTSSLNGTETQSPVVPLKKRGKPRKQPLIPRGTAGENAIMSASTPPRRDGLRRCRERM